MKALRYFALVAVLAACSGSDDPNADVSGDSATIDPAPAPGTTPPAASAPNDAQIAHIATTANTLDIEGGNTAKDKAQNAEVKQFAQRMVTEHTASNQEATALAQSLSLTPEDNPDSQQMKADHEAAKQMLAGLTGAQFDRAYIDHEVSMHQKVLDALDQKLIPNAQNQQLKDLLGKARQMVSSHLENAKAIQGKLSAQ